VSLCVAVEIDERFRGIPGVALGGYVGGLLARELDGGEVTLRRPVPLGKPLRLLGAEDGTTAGGAILSPDGTPLALAQHTLVPTSWGVPLGVYNWRA
jgi:hypothetical protein